MNWLKKLFGTGQSQSANLAKERLQIIVAHQRKGIEKPDFLPKLQQEITDVLAKYVDIDRDQVIVDFDRRGDKSILELNITIPEQTEQNAKPAAAQKTTAKKKSTTRSKKTA